MTDCYRPCTIQELGDSLTRLTPESIVLAGGTDLIIRMRNCGLHSDIILSLSDIDELKKINITPHKAEIGAMATMHQIQTALDGLDDLQALADAAGGVGSPQIRNKGTIGGNVANSSPAGDLPPVLWLLNATAEILGPGGLQRSVPVQEIPVGNQKNTLALGEVIVRFVINRDALAGWKSAFVKLGHRSQVTISRIGIAMAMKQDDHQIIEDVRVVVGAIKPVPFPLPAAEEILRGRRLDPALAIELGKTFKGNTRRVYKENAAKGVFEDILLRFQHPI